MPRTRASETFVFEIKEWKPFYSFALNFLDDRNTDYREDAQVEIQTVCVRPKNLAGRTTHFVLAAKRDCLSPNAPRRGSGAPKDIGTLRLSPSGGTFSGIVPHETLAFLMAGLGSGTFRYAELVAPPLRKGESRPFRLHLTHSAD